MRPEMEALAMLNTMFESHDGRPVDMAVLHRKDYGFLAEVLSNAANTRPEVGEHEMETVEFETPCLINGEWKMRFVKVTKPKGVPFGPASLPQGESK